VKFLLVSMASQSQSQRPTRKKKESCGGTANLEQ
jgi:hypothetical protein